MALIYNALMSMHMAALNVGRRLHREERGQDVIEYVVLAGFIGILAAAALFAVMPGAFGTMAATIESCVTFEDTCAPLVGP